MAIREVPRRFVYSCDRCGKEHEQVNSTGHYANSIPPGWSNLRHDSTLSLSSDFTHSAYLLCEECSVAATTAIGQLFASRKERQEEAGDAPRKRRRT